MRVGLLVAAVALFVGQAWAVNKCVVGGQTVY